MNKYFLSKTKDGVWSVLFGESEGKSVWINDYRAKSRSRYEMQHLLDHVNMMLKIRALQLKQSHNAENE